MKGKTWPQPNYSKQKGTIALRYEFIFMRGGGSMVPFTSINTFITLLQNAQFDDAIKKYTQSLNYIKVRIGMFGRNRRLQ